MRGMNMIPCFSSIKRPIIPDSSISPLSSSDLNRPFIPSPQPNPIFRNFNTLFDYNNNDTCSIRSEPVSDPEPDFAAAFASERFFFASPGRSNSITESCPSVSTVQENHSAADSSPSDQNSESMDGVDEDGVDEDGVAVQTYSPDPYADFRRSMEEMVAARGLHDAKANWEKLHELLLCYLALNPKNTHGFIVRAFSDLLVTLISPEITPAPETKCT